MIDGLTLVSTLVSAVLFFAAAGWALLGWRRSMRGGPAQLFSLTAGIAGIVCALNFFGRVGRTAFFEQYEGYLEILIFPLALFWLYAERTARHMAAMRRMHAEKILRGTLLDAVQDSVFLNDRDGRILYANEAALRSRGYTKTSAPLHVAALEASEPGADASLTQSPMPDEGVVLRAAHLRQDGTPFPVEIHAKQITYGGAPAVLSVVRDISERERAAADRERMLLRLQQAEKLEALGRLAGGVAHDFNNALVPILGYADLLLEEAAPGSKVEKAATNIARAAEHAVDIVQQVRTLQSRGEDQLEPVFLQAVLNDVISLLEPVMPETIALRTDIATECPPVKTSASDFRRVCMNLIGNARQAIGEGGGVIEVVLRCDAYMDTDVGDVLLIVSDTGVGMRQEDIARVFEPYFSTKRDTGGTGLGLAVVDRVVRQAGGRIAVESEQGKGSRFLLRFRGMERPDA